MVVRDRRFVRKLFVTNCISVDTPVFTINQAFSIAVYPHYCNFETFRPHQTVPAATTILSIFPITFTSAPLLLSGSHSHPVPHVGFKIWGFRVSKVRHIYACRATTNRRKVKRMIRGDSAYQVHQVDHSERLSNCSGSVSNVGGIPRRRDRAF